MGRERAGPGLPGARAARAGASTPSGLLSDFHRQHFILQEGQKQMHKAPTHLSFGPLTACGWRKDSTPKVRVLGPNGLGSALQHRARPLELSFERRFYAINVIQLNLNEIRH